MSTLAFLLAARDHVDSGEALFWIGVLIVVGCLVGAAYLAYLSNVIGAVLLLVVAIIAAVLLL
jgi:ATP/ADP translocase